MNADQKRRLIDFLSRKMCGPCRRDGAEPAHAACCEAQDLIAVVEAEPTS